MNLEFNPRVDGPVFSRALPSENWRAWLSVPGAFLSGRNKDDQLRLWLLLADGRVLVLRLLGLTPDDALATALALALIDDVAGDVLEPGLDVAGWAGVLYGAPASPVLCVAPESAAFGMALRRYPMLVAPILLTHQRWPNLDEIKRFRWRAHDDAVVAAIDNGRDLSGALARHCGISRALVRSPYCAQAWPGSSGRALADLLKFLDAIPAHQRPSSGAEDRLRPPAGQCPLRTADGCGTDFHCLHRRFRTSGTDVETTLVQDRPALICTLASGASGHSALRLQAIVETLINHGVDIRRCRTCALRAERPIQD